VLRHWVTTGQIEADDLVINEELAGWVLTSEAVELDDVFQKPESAPAPDSAEEAVPEPAPDIVEPNAQEEEVRVPDCAFHAGRTASEICVGCGKFICEECRERIEQKAYCRRCMAEKHAGIEPGAPVGPDAEGSVAPGAGSVAETSRLAIASVVLLVCALLVSVVMVVPRPNIMIAPIAGFVAFMAALLGGLALSRIRQSGNSLRGMGLALSGLIAGGVVLAGTLVVVFVFVTRGGAAAGGGPGGSDAPIPTIAIRRPGGVMRPGRRSTADVLRDRDAGARRLLDQGRALMAEDKLEEAVEKFKTMIRLYPETQIAKTVEGRLPVLVEELDRRRAEAETLKQQEEGAAQRRYEHADQMYIDGDEATAVEFLRSIIENYPETEAANKAADKITAHEERIAAENMERRDGLARELVAQADRLMEAEEYGEALQLYLRALDEYPETPTAAAAKVGLKRAETLTSDPSERAFVKIQKDLKTKTYEESVAMLRNFLGKYPETGHSEEAKKLLEENTKQKRTADNLHNFGRAYFEDGKYEVALGRYSKLIKEYPRSRWFAQGEEKYEATLRKLRE